MLLFCAVGWSRGGDGSGEYDGDPLSAPVVIGEAVVGRVTPGKVNARLGASAGAGGAVAGAPPSRGGGGCWCLLCRGVCACAAACRGLRAVLAVRSGGTYSALRAYLRPCVSHVGLERSHSVIARAEVIGEWYAGRMWGVRSVVSAEEAYTMLAWLEGRDGPHPPRAADNVFCLCDCC